MVAAATAVAWAVAMVQVTEATRLRRGWRRRWRAVALAAAAAACGRVVFLFELTHADHSQHVRAVSTWFEPSRAPCSATAAARLAAWVAGGGLGRRQRRDVGGLCGGGGAIAAADQGRSRLNPVRAHAIRVLSARVHALASAGFEPSRAP